MKQPTTSITIGPAVKMRYWGAVRKVRVQHPINHKGRVFVRSVVRPKNQTPKEVCAVFVCANKNRIYKEQLEVSLTKVCQQTWQTGGENAILPGEATKK